MSKMSELSQTIEDLKSAAEALLRAAEVMVYAFGGEEEPTEAEAAQHAPRQPEPEQEPAIKLEDVRAVLAEISRSGKTAEMKALLGRFGASKLSAVNPEDYPALLEAAREVKNA